MKVIKVKKNYRNGSLTFVEIVHSDPGLELTDEDLEQAAADICANDSAGQMYGYTYTWEIVTDHKEIIRVVGQRVKDIFTRIECLEAEKKQYFDSFPEIKPIIK